MGTFGPAQSGANADITSLAGLTTPLTVAQGGQGTATLADGGLLVGAGTGAVEVVAAGLATEILVGGGASTNPVWTTVTGTGAPVKATSPTLVTPALGTPTSGTLTSCTGLPPSTGLSTFVGPAKGGTGVANNAASTITISGNYATTLTVTEATSVTLPASGTLATTKALTPVTDSAANFAGNFTGANLYGGTFICNVTGTCQLPEMAAGMNFTIITLGAIAVVVDTHANDGYLMDGTTNAEGKNITNLSTAGDIAVFQYYTADDWLITTNGWTPEA